MNRKSHAFILAASIITVTILLPFLFSYLLNNEWLQFISGPIESWIGFWGSYIGAIIGSAAVFIVAKHQIKKQHEQQINDIQAESEELFERKMEGYAQRKRIEKLDEMLTATTKLYTQMRMQADDMLEHLIRTSEKYGNTTNWPEEFLDERMTHLEKGFHTFLSESKKQFYRISTLSSYITETSDAVDKLAIGINEFQNDIILLINKPKNYLKRFYEYDHENEQLHMFIPTEMPIKEMFEELLTTQHQLLEEELRKIEQITLVQFNFTPADEQTE